MKLQRKIYATRNEKIKDFLIGFFGWFILNVLVGVALTVALTGASSFIITAAGNTSMGDVFTVFSVLLNCIPFVLNIAALLFFVFTRHWIALGMLGAFGASLLIALCATVVFAAICFSALGGGQ